MQPIRSVLLVLLMGFALAACGDRSEEAQEVESAQDTQAATEVAGEIQDETQDNSDQSAKLHALLEEYFEARLLDRPEALTTLSRSERFDEWDLYNDDQVALDLERDTMYLERLRAEIDRDALPSAGLATYLIAEETLFQRIERAGLYLNNYAVNHRGSPASYVNVFLANRHQVNSIEDAEAYLTRLNRVEQVLQQTVERIEARVAYGLHAPAFMYPQIIDETVGLAMRATPDTVETHPVMIDFTAKVAALDVSDADGDRLLEEARTALLGPVSRGYQIYIAALQEAQSHTTTDDGIWRHPRGEEDYASRIRVRLGSDIDPDAIHDFGLSEVARIQAEMQGIMTEVGFEGSLQEFFTYMNETEEFMYLHTDEGRAQLLADLTAAMGRVNEVAPQYFNLLPRAEVEMRRVEPFREAGAGRAFYNRPAPDGSVPGIVYINQANMDEWRTWHVDTLSFHEAVPGHHFQIAYAQELESVPRLQRFAFQSAYGEGWALYTERLSYELGLFSDPYANFGRLNAELFRAVRLVVDTGLHHKRWSRQEATDYMAENTPHHPDFVDEEIRRYLVWPTQALGYKWGMTEILRLREWAQGELGESFDIRAFHDAVIGNGGVPLPVLRHLVADYVSRAGGAAHTLEDFMQEADAAHMSESGRLNAFFADLYEAETMNSPERLTRFGRRERMGEWDDYSDEATLYEAIVAARNLQRMRSEFDYDALDETAQRSYRIFEHRSASQIDTAQFYRQFYPVHQMFNFPSQSMLTLTQYHRVETVEDAEAYIERIANYEGAMGQIAANVRDRTSIGVVPPAFTYPLVLEGVEPTITGAPFDEGEPSPLWADFTTKVEALDTSDDERARLLTEAEVAFTGPMRRGFDDLIASINEAIPHSTHDDGVWRVPDGEAFYAQRVRAYTQGTMTPEEIHEWGLRDVATLHDEMRAIQAEIGYEGTLQEFFEHLNTSPDNYYPDTDEGRAQFLEDATRMTEDLMARTPEFFNLLPEAPIVVRRIEAYRESGGTIAHYNRPAPDGSQPGIYYANLATMGNWPRHTMEAITYHEGVPGHHFQIALAQEREGLPDFRTLSFGNTAYVEGWGLYSELVAYEMGAYQDPQSNFGRLATDLWRAVRLVVDTGLHQKGWTRQEAYVYMMENTPLGEDTVRREINRYIVWPGQALAYRAGRQRILELRTEAREALGDDFDIRTFHDAILGSGAVPMPVLEEIIRDYIEVEQAN